MRATLKTMVFLGLLIPLSSQTFAPPQIDTLQIINERQQRETRQFRFFILPNHLQVLLISDPEASHAAAAMNVGIGSLADPPEHRGLAHYLEHVLFLGSDKYPSAGEYQKFISLNGGDSNAYTSLEDTNYFFEINPSSFPEALDRFAEFFIAPSFNADYLERERMNVDSEYALRQESTYRRVDYLARQHMAPAHPLRSVFQGSQQSLARTTQDDLKRFYQTYYSPRIMHLALASPFTLDQMEAMARNTFGSVPNRPVSVPKIPSELFTNDAAPALMQVKSQDQSRSLIFRFDLAPTFFYWREKPMVSLMNLLNYAGPNSLPQQLKAQGLITHMRANYEENSFRTLVNIEMKLTDAGSSRHQELVKAFFRYLRTLQTEGLKPYIFTQAAERARLSYVFGARGKGMNMTAEAARELKLYGPSQTEAHANLFWQYDRDLFAQVAEQIRPDNLLLFYTSPDIQGTQSLKEYEIRFNRCSLRGEPWFTELSHLEPDSSLYPESNPFFPVQTRILPKTLNTTTHRLFDEKGVHWHRTETRFGDPIATLTLQMHTGRAVRSPRDQALGLMLTAYLGESLNAWNFHGTEAGYTLAVSDVSGTGEFSLTANGYSDRLVTFFTSALARLKVTRPSERDIELAKTRITNFIREVTSNNPILQSRWTMDSVVRPHSYSAEQILTALQAITIQDVEAFQKDLLKEMWVEAASFGNLTFAEVEQFIPQAFKAVQATPPRTRVPMKTLRLDPGTHITAVAQNSGINNVWRSWYQMGPFHLKDLVILRVLETLWESTFYNEMRTKRSLGYIVASGIDANPLDLGMQFMIQSEKPASDVGAVALSWIQQAAQDLAKLPDAEFASVKSALNERWMRPEESYYQELGKWTQGLDLLLTEGNMRQLLIAELNPLKKEEFVHRIQTLLDPKTEKRVTVHVNGRGVAPSLSEEAMPGEKSYYELDRWKAVSEWLRLQEPTKTASGNEPSSHETRPELQDGGYGPRSKTR